MRVFRSVVVLLAVFAAVATAVPSADAAEKFRVVRVSYSTGWDALPIVVGIERGFFAERNLIVSGVSAGSAVAVAQSLQAGSTDAAILPQRAFLGLLDADIDIKAILVNTWGSQFQLVARDEAGISDVASLRGKRVGVALGSGSLPVLVRLLNQAGLSPQDVKLQELQTNALIGALREGRIDAVFEFAHLSAPMAGAGLGSVVMSGEDVRNALGLVGAMPVVANARFLEREPETAQALVEGWVEAQRYIHQEPEDSERLLAIFLHRHGVVAPKELVRTWVGMQRYDAPKWTQAAIDDARYNAWGLRMAGGLKEIPDVAAAVDNRFVDALPPTTN